MKTQYIIPCRRMLNGRTEESAHFGVLCTDSGNVAIQQIKGGNVSVTYLLNGDDARDMVNALLDVLKGAKEGGTA